MYALVTRAGDTAPVLVDVEPAPLGPAEVRIRVAAATVNPVDLITAAGPGRQMFGLPDEVGLGWDLSGTVAEIGSGISDLRVGDRVAALDTALAAPTRAHATLVTLPADQVVRVPDGLDLHGAATIPLNALAARQALDLFGPADGRSLLITGAAGAVGGFAVALAARDGWQVTGLVRTQEDAEFVRGAGAQRVRTDLPGPEYDAVLDAAGLQEKGIAFVRDGGTYVGAFSHFPVPSERGVEATAVATQPDADALVELLRLAADGVLELRVAGTVPLADGATAYDKVAAGGHRGRWLLVP